MLEKFRKKGLKTWKVVAFYILQMQLIKDRASDNRGCDAGEIQEERLKT
jgi:hypothetical protein